MKLERRFLNDGYPSKHVRREQQENIICNKNNKNIASDWLVHLPIKEDKIIWSIDESHTYDSLVVLDHLGKAWSVAYYCDAEWAPIEGEDFIIWTQWLKHGKKPSNISSVVEKHQKAYEHTTAVGLAIKCIQCEEYGRSLREVMEENIEKRYKEGEFQLEEKEQILDELYKVFNQISMHPDVTSLSVYSEHGELIEMIEAIKPFDFIGVYHWGNCIQFEREDYMVGKALSDLPIPKSVELLTDEKLAESDYLGYTNE